MYPLLCGLWDNVERVGECEKAGMRNRFGGVEDRGGGGWEEGWRRKGRACG